MQGDPFMQYLIEAAEQGGNPAQQSGYASEWNLAPDQSQQAMNWVPGFAIPTEAQAAAITGGTNDFRAPRRNAPSLDPNPEAVSRAAPDRPYQAAQASNIKPGTIEAYIRQAAVARGMDPDVALRVAKHEGGYDDNDPARRGTFATGSSWWPFQLHYGGAGTPYAHYGTTAGMGNDFTERTGYQPGDPAAWAASVDFALDHARKNGWGAWYGRTPAGVGIWDGIPR